MLAKITIFEGDITELSVDAIVNAANSSLLGGGGVDGAIHKAAGQGLLLECRDIGGCPTGEARVTKAYDLRARLIIHTVGPVWRGGQSDEDQLLTACYSNSVMAAVANDVKTIAFSAISTGVYGFPPPRAAKIAVATVRKHLKHAAMIEEVIFVCFNTETARIYREIV